MSIMEKPSLPEHSTASEEEFLSRRFPTKKNLEPIQQAAEDPVLELWHDGSVPALVTLILFTIIVVPIVSILLVRIGVDNPLSAGGLTEASLRSLGFDDDIGHDITRRRKKNWTVRSDMPGPGDFPEFIASGNESETSPTSAKSAFSSFLTTYPDSLPTTKEPVIRRYRPAYSSDTTSSHSPWHFHNDNKVRRRRRKNNINKLGVVRTKKKKKKQRKSTTFRHGLHLFRS
ncbi:uncharacterized protein LOC135366724 isoform X2 [Ornithodoros turicata]|uniref:uncharacterized protein LOC135366724 isoform X2 n=1 Tax=Ornithodoros turicata TaxID=34597 RepID=UPI00313A2143